MRVLNFSLDKSMLDANSPVARRIAALSAAAGEVVMLTPFSHRGGKVRQFFRLWKQANAILREKKFSAKGGPASGWDLITVQDTSYLAFLAYLLARKFHLPLEVQMHGFEKFYGIRKLIAQFVLRRADKVRVVSERLKKELETRFTIQDSKIYVLQVYAQGVPPTTPPRGLGTPPQAGGDEKDIFTFLTVGRLVPVKNIALQIRAFARIAKEFPRVRLVIVGAGPLFHNFQFSIFNFQLQDKIFLEGRQSDLARYYKNADAFLLTSNSEGWGVVVIEAAAHGVPIIMTDVGCAGEFIKNGENSVVIQIGDEDALVGAMKNIITDWKLRARLGESARKAFLALPTPEKQIKEQVLEWKEM